MAQDQTYNSSQANQNGEQLATPQDESNNPQFLWTTDTIVINGNPVRVIFPNQEDSN